MLPKLVYYEIALNLSLSELIKFLKTCKKYYDVWIDSRFWGLKLKRDYPYLYVPYIDSDLKRVYAKETRRLELKNKFIFVEKLDDLGLNERAQNVLYSEHEGEYGRAQNNLLHTTLDRVVAILYGLAGHEIWKEYLVDVYGYYGEDRQVFQIHRIEDYLGVWFEKGFDKHDIFMKDLEELINSSMPKYFIGSKIKYHTLKWEIQDEYFKRCSAINSLIPYQEHTGMAKKQLICILEAFEEIILFHWMKLQSLIERKTEIIGNYYGRDFKLYHNKNKIYLLVEPLTSDKFVNELRDMVCL